MKAVPSPARLLLLVALAVAMIGSAAAAAFPHHPPVAGAAAPSALPAAPRVLDLWAAGRAAFGVFVPDERPRAPRGEGPRERRPPVYSAAGGESLGRNPLYDYLFLNLEGGYDGDAVAAIAAGLERAGVAGDKALLVRIPPISRDGEETTRARVAEILAAGGDGVVFPHVRGPEEAALAVSLLSDAGADVWSPSNPGGDKIAMIMIEDPESLARVAATAAVEGISILACGIGSLRSALDGDREAAEAGNQQVLEYATRAGLVDMITANSRDVAQRVDEGFLALLMQGAGADEAIRAGRAAAGR